MTDHKFTDNEIKKALECCSRNTEYDCNYCPYFVDDEITTTQCMCNLMKLALDLINRRDAEIERLQKECEITRAYIHNNGLEWGLVSHLEFYKNQRAEAIKEFAERLKENRFEVNDLNEDIFFAVDISDIDNLVEEMERENDR